MKKLEDLPSIKGAPAVYPLTDAPYELAQFILQASQEEPQPSAILVNYLQGTVSVYPRTSQSPQLEFTRESLIYLISNEPLSLVPTQNEDELGDVVRALEKSVGEEYEPHTLCVHPDRKVLTDQLTGDVLCSPIVSQNSILLVASATDKDVSPSWKALVASLPIDLHIDSE